MAKKILFIQQTAPHGTFAAQEGLEAILMASNYDYDVSLFFRGAGVLQLKNKQEFEGICYKNFTAAYKALSLYDIEKVYIDAQSLSEYGLNLMDLMIKPQLVSAQKIQLLLSSADYDLILTF